MPATRKTSPRFGSHLSIAGGLENALSAGVEVGCDCLQLFVKNQRQWRGKPLTAEIVSAFRRAVRASRLKPVVAHATYLINLASPDTTNFERSVDALTDELERCEQLGIPFLVVHPGAHLGAGVDAGIARIVQAVDALHQRTAGFRCRLLLETTAGQGSSIGCEIEQLGRIVAGVGDPQRLGVCLDTCHLFAAGYDLSRPDEYERTVQLLRRHVGLRRVKCIHVNDSKRECGSRVDRHDHIGRGRIGRRGFVHLVNDQRFARVPMILETPKGKNGRGEDWDRVNLRTLRWLVGKPG